MKTNFSITIKMTSTKLIAWAIFIWSHIIFRSLPEESVVYYLCTVYGVIVFLYTGKNIQEYYKKKLTDNKKAEG